MVSEKTIIVMVSKIMIIFMVDVLIHIQERVAGTDDEGCGG